MSAPAYEIPSFCPQSVTGAEGFLDAVGKGALASVKKWLAEDRALVDAKAENGLSPVTIAAHAGRDDVLNEILSHRPALTVHEAAILGDFERVRALVEARPKLANDSSAADGLAPLGLAAQFGCVEIARYLLSMGADVNYAVPGGHAKVVRLLIDAGADVNHRYEHNRFSPLITGAAAGDLAIVRMLVEVGADLHARTADGKTALAVAVEWRNREVAEYLEGLGAT